MSDGALTQDEIDAILDAVDAKVEKEHKEMIDELKKADTMEELISSIRSGYMGEFRYNFYLTKKECGDIIRHYIQDKHKDKR